MSWYHGTPPSIDEARRHFATKAVRGMRKAERAEHRRRVLDGLAVHAHNYVLRRRSGFGGTLEDRAMIEHKADHFPYAPADWTPGDALKVAEQEHLELGEDHWEMVRALQEFFARHADTPAINKRELHDALGEKFHVKGGLRHLYEIFPGGPVAQGCRLAGLKVPEGAIDRAFGSVS